MKELEILEILSNVGVIGILLWLSICFMRGDLVSKQTVDETLKKINNAQVDHIKDLRDSFVAKMDKMIGILEEIRKNGAMNNRRKQ